MKIKNKSIDEVLAVQTKVNLEREGYHSRGVVQIIRGK
jgi:hypothetical protein